MKSLRISLIETWDLLTKSPSGDREWRALRIETEHPMDVFAAIRENDKTRAILFEVPIKYSPKWKLRFDSEGLRLQDVRDNIDGKRRIVLSLERIDLESVFLVITEDLIESSRVANSIEEALLYIGKRLSTWQTCLKVRRQGFTQERMIGLYGELIVLQKLAKTIGLDRAIESWEGPERGLQDFKFGQIALEIKTSIGINSLVHITSLEQLDPSSLRILALCHIMLVRDDQGLALFDLVVNIRDRADEIGPSIRREFDQRILMAGYPDNNSDELHIDHFSLGSINAYKVKDKFPRLTRELVSTAIVSTEYTLDLSTSASYLMSAEELENIFMQFSMGAINGY